MLHLLCFRNKDGGFGGERSLAPRLAQFGRRPVEHAIDCEAWCYLQDLDVSWKHRTAKKMLLTVIRIQLRMPKMYTDVNEEGKSSTNNKGNRGIL